jgi:osmotically-inducible protein OsmY
MSGDTNTIERVRAALAADPRLHNPGAIAVSERAGNVTLRGTVRSPHQRRSAVETAGAVRGVRSVQDGLQLDPRDHWEDAEIRGAALQALIADERVPHDRIDVGAANGWLTLRGEVRDQGASNAAFETASQIAGVGGITNRIEVMTGVTIKRTA